MWTALAIVGVVWCVINTVLIGTGNYPRICIVRSDSFKFTRAGHNFWLSEVALLAGAAYLICTYLV